ncbi:unnamed protein product [Dovyalis caffra]|uniref:tRNA-uridine aminocarboxypropyltransferase n=1 Tax=Dovyalis caffra TaxID=77055 RepID=A0AAV1RP31_9ROSI|nr:unnamed protein product [Dovyalis caffra]
MAATQLKSKRPTCPSCSKPASLCLCIRIQNPGLQNKVNITILQHSLERKHPLNSARIAKLGLKNVTVSTVSDVKFDAKFTIHLLDPGHDLGSGQNGEKSSDFYQVMDDKVDEFHANHVIEGRKEPVITFSIGKYGVVTDIGIGNVWMPHVQWKRRLSFDKILASKVAVDDLEKGFVVKKLQKKRVNGSEELEELEEFEVVVLPGSVLLFPSKNGFDIDGLKAMNFEVKNLIVLDGTWSKARRMFCENPWLRFLPHLKLDLDKLSLYSEIRHQPKAGYLSTIESIVYALEEIGDYPEGLDDLLGVFESMVVDQRRFKDERLSKLSSA